MLGKERVSQNFCICSVPFFIAKYSYEREEKLFANFDRVLFQGEEEFNKFEIHFCS